MEYRIGIIDDDGSKMTQLLTFVSLGWEDEEGNLLKENYKDIVMNPFEISLEKSIDAMVEKIVAERPDALIIDFKLSSQQNIAYSGVALAKKIDERLRDFPVFILTSYQEDLYTKECFDAYQVFDFERYIEDTQERLEVNSKLVQQARKYVATIDAWKKELAELLPLAGSNVAIDERLLELDSLIENSVDGTSALPRKIKQDLGDTKRIQLLIEKIDKLIEGE